MTTNQRSLRLNRHLFTETGTDSGALNVLGTLVHQFPDAGDYVVEVSRDGELVGRELLVVSDEYHAVQATFDLSTVGERTDTGDCGCESPCTCEDQDYTCIREDGFAVFHVGRGPGGYTVVVDPVGERREAREFESTELTEVDTFAAVLLRPGEYAMRNLVTDHEGSVVVTYPDPDSERGREARRESVTVECTDDGFDPEAVELHPAQGLVFRVETPSRVEVELVEPHERATGDAGPVRVRNPRRPVLSDRRRTLRPRLDPGEFSADDLESELASVTNPLEVRAILATERRSKNRSNAVEAITARLEELERERDRRTDEQ